MIHRTETIKFAFTFLERQCGAFYVQDYTRGLFYYLLIYLSSICLVLTIQRKFSRRKNGKNPTHRVGIPSETLIVLWNNFIDLTK